MLGPESSVDDLGSLQLRRQLRQAQLMLLAHAIETGKTLGQSRHRLPGVRQPGERRVALLTGTASVQLPANAGRVRG